MVSSAQNNLTDAALTPARVNSEIAVSVLSKSLDAQRQQGADVVEMIDDAGQTGPQPGDPLVAQATGLGGLLDISA